MNEKQKQLIAHLFTIESKWNHRIIDEWKENPKVKPIIGDIPTEEIYEEGIRFKNEMNEEIGMGVY